MASEPSSPILTTREITVFENDFVLIRNDEVVFSDGGRGTYVRVSNRDDNPGVVVIPWAQGKVGLVRVYRYPLSEWQWGFPRGFGQDPDPLLTARAELAEEIGEGMAQTAHFQLVGSFTPDSGILSSRVSVVLALGEEQDRNPTDLREVAEVAWMTPDHLNDLLGSPCYDDGMTLAALALGAARGVLPW